MHGSHINWVEQMPDARKGVRPISPMHGQMLSVCSWLMLCLSILFGCVFVQAQTPTRPTPNSSNQFSVLIEAAGKIEYLAAGQGNWEIAVTGLNLKPGDRIRTYALSRAAIQLSDRSVVRLNERTTLEILPPRHSEKKRFGLPGGSIFFFNRERPADVEFDTPLAAGAIRGTEFLLETAPGDSALRLALIDGLVTLQTGMAKFRLNLEKTFRSSLASRHARQRF
ncbi:MAG TPA: FecR family protein [Verrucomicrobiae bacterium]